MLILIKISLIFYFKSLQIMYFLSLPKSKNRIDEIIFYLNEIKTILTIINKHQGIYEHNLNYSKNHNKYYSFNAILYLILNQNNIHVHNTKKFCYYNARKIFFKVNYCSIYHSLCSYNHRNHIYLNVIHISIIFPLAILSQ